MRNGTRYTIFVCLLLMCGIYACRKAQPFDENDIDKRYSGGINTVFDESVGAFGHPFSTLTEIQEQIHEIGDANFEATFVTAPAPIHSGLGPVFNNVSCSSCHIADGRGKPAISVQGLSSILFRLSIPGQDDHGGPLAAPGFGGQLQGGAISGKLPEATVTINYVEESYTFPDGEIISLRRPSYQLSNSYVALPTGIMVSPRVAPPVFGLGLLEAIEEETILKNADESDVNGDGISGKANYVWNIKKQKATLGRFGWKAGAPDLLQQSAGAYNQDMGVTNSLFPIESCYDQTQYDNLNDEVEVSDSILNAVAFYMRTLSVPARRDVMDTQISLGEKIFKEANCSGCHIPQLRTAMNVAFPQVSNQLIFPYTDLLLHDMGSDLADYRPDFKADGLEWRTQALWGIGLTKVVNGHNNFLHDGRARSIMEAILWHGGEAENSKNYVKGLSKSERDALIAFLNSL